MKKVIIILITIWTVLCGITVACYFMPRDFVTDGVTVNQDYAMSDDSIYLSENASGHAVIFKFDKNGNREDAFIGRINKSLKGYTVDAITYNQTLYGLFKTPALYEGRDVTAYKIVRFGENMAISETSDLLVLGANIKVTHLSSDDKDLYISALKTDRQEAYVYKVAIDSLHEYKTGGPSLSGFKDQLMGKSGGQSANLEKEKFYELDTMIFDVVENGRYYADFAYEPGEKHVRLDNEKPDEFFTVPAVVKSAYGALEITSRDSNMIKGVSFVLLLLVWLGGIPVIIVFSVLLHDRNRAVYMGAVMELVLLIVCALGVFALIRSVSKITEDEHREYTEYIMETALSDVLTYDMASLLGSDSDLTSDEKEERLLAFYSSESYVTAMDTLEKKAYVSEGGWGLESLAIVNRSTGEIVISDDVDNRASVDYVYGTSAGTFARNANISNSVRTKDVTINGEEKVAFAKSLDRRGLDGYTLLGIANVKETASTMAVRYNTYIRDVVIVFLIASAIIVFFLIYENRDVRSIARMLRVLAEGRGVLRNPTVHGRDLNSMKNSAFEIEKNITTVNRAKYKLFEAYYRFAPKSIEKMLGRDSITEVEIGDRAEIDGTMAILSMKENRRADGESLAYMNKTFEIMEQRRSEHDGIYVTNNETLSRARILFLQNNHQAVNFGMDILNSMREWKKRDYTDTLVLLHYTTFSYGICGTDTQSMAFLASRETERLSMFAEWLRGLRLSLVITGTVLEREGGFGEIRHIGFVKTDTNNRLELYEVLGAQIGRSATAKRKTKDAFEAALAMFYDKDFYLARNAFTDILREAPEDELVKWYLFECETQLNGTADDTFTGALHL